MADKKISELTELTTPDGTEELVVNDSGVSKKIQIDNLPTPDISSKVNKSGDTMTGDLNLGDNVKAQFGAGNDLQIYHDGSNSYIKDSGVGGLRLLADADTVIRAADNSTARASFGGDVKLYHNGSAKLATTSTGIDVTGSVTADGLTVDANSTTGAVKIQSGDNNTFGTGRVQLAFGYGENDDYQHFVRTSHDIVSSGNRVELFLCDGTQNNTISSGSTRVATFAGSGDISFYEDTGTTPKFFWDASAESLGIGTSSPNAKLQTSDASGVNTLAIDDSRGNVGDMDVIDFRHKGITGSQIKSEAIEDFSVSANRTSDLQFYTRNNGTISERMRIDSSGYLLINTTSPFTNAPVQIKQENLSLACLNTWHSGTSGTRYHLEFRDGSSPDSRGSITTNGSSTAYNTTSDYRLKENVVPMTGSIDRLKALKPSKFNFIADADKTVDGFLAHEAQEVVPECVSGTKDAMKTEEYEVEPAVKETITIPAIEAVEATYDDEGNVLTEAIEAQEERTEERVVTEAVMGEREVPDYQGIDQSKLVPLLVASLQEAVEKIEALEARVTELEA